MDTLNAFSVTLLAVTNNRDVDEKLGTKAGDPCGLPHLFDMQTMMRVGDFSEDRRNRFLGYLQGVAVARGLLTLDDVKQINVEHGAKAPDA